MDVNNEVVVINTDHIKKPKLKNTLFETRVNAYEGFESTEEEITIFVVGFFRVEKTKRCVESIIKYTKDISYRLILIDNGMDEETFSYYKTVAYENKEIIRITKNINSVFAYNFCFQNFKSKYIAVVANDVVVTKNWISNMMNCIKSDEHIGMVTCMTSNDSNLQQVDLQFESYEEMQVEAEKFNVTNPRLWEERCRLIPEIAFLKKEVIDNVGIWDYGFYHDFSDDDFSVRVRRSGYKLMLCGDTFVHHDHDFRNMEDKNSDEFMKSIETGRKNFKEKFHGLDAWDDLNNFERQLISLLPTVENKIKSPEILGLDVRCGTPLLEIKNFLRKNGVFNSTSTAYTSDAKYFQELLYATEGNAFCDRMEYLSEHLPLENYDYVILGESINLYNKPITLLQKLIEVTAKGGKLLFKLKNNYDVSSFLFSLGNNLAVENEMASCVKLDELLSCLELMKVTRVNIDLEGENVSEEVLVEVEKTLNRSGLVKNVEEVLTKLRVKNYLICVTK